MHNIRTLEGLNRHWSNYLEEYYHTSPHAGIREYYESMGVSVPEGGISPVQEWNRDSRPLTFLDASVVAEAFLHHEERLVDKGACISFRGKKFETRPALIGCTVGIAYDPMVPEILTVSYHGMEPFTARPLKIGAFCDKNPALHAAKRSGIFPPAGCPGKETGTVHAAPGRCDLVWQLQKGWWGSCIDLFLKWNVCHLSVMSRYRNCMNPLPCRKPCEGWPMQLTVSSLQLSRQMPDVENPHS